MINFKSFINENDDWDHTNTWVGTDRHTTHFEPPVALNKSIKDLSPEEKDCVNMYSGSSHKELNNFHRNGSTYPEKSYNDYIERNTKHIDSAINKNTLEHNTHVWRGIHPAAIAEMGLHKAEKGTILHDKGFTSTSLKPSQARKFGETIGYNEHIAHIKLPKGSKALHLNQHEISMNEQEHEVLLPRNSKYRYEGYKDYKTRSSAGAPGILTVHHLTHIPEGHDENI